MFRLERKARLLSSSPLMPGRNGLVVDDEGSVDGAGFSAEERQVFLDLRPVLRLLRLQL